MNEKRVRSKVITLLKPINAFAVENVVHDGTPDVCTVMGWIELKVSDWPKRESSPVKVKMRPAQRIWHRNWRLHGGKAWTISKIGKTWVLHRGDWAAKHLGRVDKSRLIGESVALWSKTPTSEKLIGAMQRTDWSG